LNNPESIILPTLLNPEFEINFTSKNNEEYLDRMSIELSNSNILTSIASITTSKINNPKKMSKIKELFYKKNKNISPPITNERNRDSSDLKSWSSIDNKTNRDSMELNKIKNKTNIDSIESNKIKNKTNIDSMELNKIKNKTRESVDFIKNKNSSFGQEVNKSKNNRSNTKIIKPKNDLILEEKEINMEKQTKSKLSFVEFLNELDEDDELKNEILEIPFNNIEKNDQKKGKIKI
jgi:hypothetical protein